MCIELSKLQSIILAGGSGTRLRPLTCDIPKPLAPICGSPCIYYILNLLKNHGIDDACITLNYKGESIRQATEQIQEMKIRCVTEEKPLGTAGSAANCKKFIDNDFLVICGDCICDFDLTAAAEFHRSHGDIATVILTKVKNPLEYGVVVTDEKGCISRFIEKPSWARAYSDTVNTGIYIFSKEIFDHIPENTECDFAKDVFPSLLEKGINIHAYTAEGYWCDVGSIAAYTKCNRDILEGKLNFQPKISVLANKTNHAPEFSDSIFIGDNVSAENADIGKYSVIGNNCVLGKNTKIENSILLDGVTMEEGSSVHGCVVCRGATLKRNVSVGEQSVVGADSEIGNYTVIGAGTKIYPKKIIPDESFVKNDVVEDFETFDFENGKIRINSKNGMTTSLLVKIGETFASVTGTDIAFGVDASRNTKELLGFAFALCSGIISVSPNTFDLGECDINIFSYAIREHGFSGGIFLSSDSDTLEITLLEKDGLTFGREKERKFESELDSNKIKLSPMGELRTFRGFEKIYEKKFSKKINTTNPLLAFLSAPKFITERFRVEPPKEKSEYIYILPQRLVVQTSEHEAYNEDLIKCVTAFCCGMIEGEVFIPYDFPVTVDSVAKKYGFECSRLTLEDKNREKLCPMTDIYYRALYLLLYMAQNKETFSDIAKKIPIFTSRRREIEVTANKAAIMRTLSEGKGKELVEGVKIRENGGTVLIIPKKIKNAFSICAESADAETAAELCDFYSKKLKK